MIRKHFLSILTALVIMFLSLTGSDTLGSVPFLNIPYFDKIAHFGMYFMFMSVLLFENRISSEGFKAIMMLAAIPFLYGIMMEIFQILFTVNRSGNVFDALANTLGIIVAAAIWIWLKPFRNKIFR
jgi:VanZ family protein